MVVTLDQANQAVDDFVAQFWKLPYSKFISSASTSTVGVADPLLPVVEHADHCILVGLKKPLSVGLVLPKVISGVRIVYFSNP